MDSGKFDRLSRSVGRASGRRSVLGLLSASVLGAGVAVRRTPQVAAQGKMPSKQEVLDRIDQGASGLAEAEGELGAQACVNPRCVLNAGFIVGYTDTLCAEYAPTRAAYKRCAENAYPCADLAYACKTARSRTCVSRWYDRWFV